MANLPTEWDLKELFTSISDPKMEQQMKEVVAANEAFVSKWKQNELYLTDPTVLREALDELEQLDLNFGQDGDVGYYLFLQKSLDLDNPDLKAKVNKIHEQAIDLYNKAQFFWLNIAKLDPAQQNIFLESEELEPYHFWLETVFKVGKYTLDDAREKIMSLKSKVSHSNWINFATQTLSNQQREVDGEPKTLEDLLNMLKELDKSKRDSAINALEDIFAQNLHIFEAEMNSILENKKINDQIRNYTRPDEARHVSDAIETEVVDALIEAVSQRYEISKKFYKFKAEQLGVEHLRYVERMLPISDTNRKYSYEEAITLTRKVFAELDPEFETIFSDYVENGKVDVFPKKGKRGGAFAISHTPKAPGYVMLNFGDSLRDVATIAHEMGHAVHHELMKEQNALNYHSSLAMAEVASTFMEDFVFQEIMAQSTEEEKFSLLSSKLDDEIATVFRQVAFYKFEWDLHHSFREKGYLSAVQIGELFKQHMDSYFGDASGAENWWTYVSHFRNFFYVYSYASGLLISKALQRMVREDKANITKVKQFMKAGGSESPKDLFAKIGIDITDPNFWHSGLDEIEQQLDMLLNTEK